MLEGLDILDALGILGGLDILGAIMHYALYIIHCALCILHYALYYKESLLTAGIVSCLGSKVESAWSRIVS